MARKYSSEYKNLQPYVVEDIRKVVNATGAAGTSGGTLEQHGLNSWYHTGELAQSQASWAATKVELSNHAALPDVHHAKLHAITDAANHSVTGSQYQIVGLTAVNTLGLLTPSATPAANAVVKTDSGSGVTLVDLTVTSDLFMSGYLDFGTDVMYEDASYLQVTGSKAVRFGQNIGNANWTLYNAGGYTTTGSISITGTAGDLDIGSHVLFVDNSAANVGINCAPDSQFAVDVNGPLRATYLIGPHAIQVKDALLIAHYDGPERGSVGEPNGHFGQVATVAGNVTYRLGKFNKAVDIAGTYTNVVTNTGFESNTTGWTDYATGTAAGTRDRVTDEAWAGDYSYRLIKTGGGNTDRWGAYTTFSATNGQSYTYSVRVKLTGVSNNTSNIVALQANTNVTTTTAFHSTANGEWTELTLTTTATATGTARLYVWVYNCDTATVYLDAVQITNTAYNLPFWGGNRSTAGSLTYSNLAVTWSQCTVMCWFRASDSAVTIGADLRLFEVISDSNNRFSAYLDASTNRLYAGHRQGGTTTSITSTTTAAAREWHHMAFVISGTTGTLYLDGVSIGSNTIANINAGVAAAWVGTTYTGTQPVNGMIDDFAIVNRALAAGDVLGIYQSNAPIFAESSTWSWRATPDGLVWADDEGLWMKDTAAKPVFGIYGGESTKSWGGFTMAPGDLLIGNNAVGSSAIWWDQSSGTFGFYGAGSGTPQVEIATDGRLTAGAGKVKLDSTGFHAFNASNVDTIDINDTGIYMGDGGARTTIASWTSGGRIQFYSVGEAYEATPETYLDDSSISRTLYPLVIRGIRQGNDAALIELAAVRSDTGAGAKIIIGEGFRLKDYFTGSGSGWNTNRVVHAIADDIILQSSKLQLSGQTTNTTQSTGVGTIKMAGATNRNNTGLLQVIIGGNVVYIPYFATITG